MNARPELPIAVRTLVAAGFTISNSERHPHHIEIECRKPDLFGVEVDYLIAIFDIEALPPAEIAHIVELAKGAARVPIVVAGRVGTPLLGWDDFLESLGGAVPNWRALGPTYSGYVQTTSANKLPKDVQGEAWQLFEVAIADGFEFLFGARVLRLGGKRRSRKVSDLVAQMPDGRTLVVDTKAYADPFNTASGSLRPLEEYTKKQVERQRGQVPVGGAVLVAARFAQDATGLHRTSADFLAATSIPLTFVEASTIVFAVERLSENTVLRSAVQWRQLFCRGGLLDRDVVVREIEDASRERLVR